uniref:hypothetical protein n=1 Tax=Halorubrum sp. T3 TaxID=1194088 RepID=UPI00042E9438|nr:hypothetical protein [Halorubrum sp. T3]AGI12353.1 hypothetical protein [Halorubrum sp. T3]
MIGSQPSRSEVEGPSDEAHGEVLARAVLDVTLVLVGLEIVVRTPDETVISLLGALVAAVALIHGVGWVMESINRALLWANTRGYNGR